MDQLRANGTPVGRSTAYRCLNALAAEGKARKFTADDAPACYQLVENTCAEHFHFKCDSCGALLHVDCDLLSQIKTHMQAEHGFELDEKKLVYYGRCKQCAQDG